MSTSVDRNAPPLLPALLSWYATPSPPSLKFSAWTVPGIDHGVPPKGVPSPVPAPTDSVALDRTAPPAPSAMSVYVVVDEAETVIDPLAATLPIDGRIATRAAPAVVHESVADCPALIDVGDTASCAEGSVRGP